jgi:glycosyltransferase involved in cell wall biosynthesis
MSATQHEDFIPARAVDRLRSLPSVFLMINNLERGGSERQFRALEGALDRDRYRVQVGCIQKTGAFLEGLGEVPSFRLGGSLYGAKSWATRLRLARHLRRGDIAVAHAFDFYTNLALIPAARLAGVPAVIGSQRQLGDLMTPWQSRVQALVFCACDRVVCNSHAAADRLVYEGVPERKIVVIGNGLPESAFRETAPALPSEAGLLRVGMVARMNADYKQHRLFLRAAARVRGKFPSLEFLLVGDGPFRAGLEKQAEELGIRDQIQFLGDRRDVAALLAAMDVSVLPSSSEGLSNVILESMAAGVPVVATNVGGNPELLGDGRGLLVPAGDEVALAAAIERLLIDGRFRLALGSKGKEFARANFSLDKISGQYEALYADLLLRKGWRENRRSSVNAGSNTSGKIRLALVAPTLRWVGGQAVQADLLMRHWRNDRDVEAQFIPLDPSFPAALAWAARVPGMRTLIREPLYLLSLWRGLKDVDVAHIFSASYWSFLLAPAPAWLIAKALGKKTVINYRSGEARDHLRRSTIARNILRNTDLLVVPSQYLVDVFHEFGLTARAVPNIVDLSQFSFRLRKPLRPHLVCTRGFHSYYGIDVVVRAFAEVRREFPDAKLDLVGGGPTENQIRSQAREMNLAGINFAGIASRQNIGSCYDQADIFINASRLDNMPVSILEAFAAGTPVVTTAPESMRYLVEHEQTGLLSAVDDAHDLANNVIRLLREPELAAGLALNAYRESERYRWEAVREQWLRVYRGLEDAASISTGTIPSRLVESDQNSAGDRRLEAGSRSGISRESPSMQTRYQSSRLSNRQMRS